MPIYEYICSGCGSKFELMRPFSKADEKADCPSCHARGERKMSTFACFSKGSSGESAPVAGTGSSCGSCGSHSCSTCGM